jgi:plasmid stabilization system protein ParE
MTGRINYTPEAPQQLNELDDWITNVASAEVARRFVSAILDHIDGILVSPLAGRARDDDRPGLRTSTFKKTTLVAYEVDESSDEARGQHPRRLPRWPGLEGRARSTG